MPVVKEPMPFVPIQRVDIYRATLERIRELIRSGNLQPGDRLPSERDLAEALGVSRAAVREALKVLESYGQVEIRIGSGTYVRRAAPQEACQLAGALLNGLNPDTHLLQDALEVRWALERQVIESLGRVTPDQAAEIRAILAEEAEEFMGGGLAEGTLNVRFERTLAHLTGNRLLVRMQATAHEAWVHILLSMEVMPADKARLHQEHLVILAALEAGNTAGALQAMRTHLDRRVVLAAQAGAAGRSMPVPPVSGAGSPTGCSASASPTACSTVPASSKAPLLHWSV